MFKLRDFLHLPEVDDLVDRLTSEDSGLILVAGIDAGGISAMLEGERIRSSGASAIFNILMQEILLANPQMQAVVIGEDKQLGKAPRPLRGRVRFVRAEPPFSYPGQIAQAAADGAGLLVVDRLSEESLPAALAAARTGARVLSQFNTVLRGPAATRALLEWGVSREDLRGLRWIVTVQRVDVLCERCKAAVRDPGALVERFCRQYPHLRERAEARAAGAAGPLLFCASSCADCRGTGYAGDVAVFDLFRSDPSYGDPTAQESLLSLEAYTLELAFQGKVDLAGLLNLDTDHLRRVYGMLENSQRALAETSARLNRKLVELEASNRVLLQRTEVLMSLQDLGQALISPAGLDDLAARVCRRAGDLCGADRVVLYLRRVEEHGGPAAQILAERGWGADMTGRRVDAAEVFGQASPDGTSLPAGRYVQIPPGFRTAVPGQGPSSGPIRSGLRVPLVAQDHLVGCMILQSTQKDFFNQGEAALLHTFANQAALAIQRAGLVDELRAKIDQLEAAQAGLVQKERMARELELARQVQQRMLPQAFPSVPGFALCARSDPARQVGGDFYDGFLLDETHFGVVIADVADKGLPAAMYMALTRSLLLAEAKRTRSPKETLANVNRLLLEVGDLNGFVSVFYGVVDIAARRLTYTRAGHERPLLLRGASVTTLGGEGTVLGVLPSDQLRLSEEPLDLQPGDQLVLYTDGLSDVLDSGGRFSGLEALKSVLAALAGRAASETCDAVFHHLNVYRGQAEQFDDMTLLVLNVAG
jgi:sigma-B regulation protein RsbU (phosphoserine phosphatase)